MNAGVGLVEARKTSEVSNTIATFLPSSVNFVAILNLWTKGAREYWRYIYTRMLLTLEQTFLHRRREQPHRHPGRY